jgi:hypothetical protein
VSPPLYLSHCWPVSLTLAPSTDTESVRHYALSIMALSVARSIHPSMPIRNSSWARARSSVLWLSARLRLHERLKPRANESEWKPVHTPGTRRRLGVSSSDVQRCSVSAKQMHEDHGHRSQTLRSAYIWARRPRSCLGNPSTYDPGPLFIIISCLFLCSVIPLI